MGEPRIPDPAIPEESTGGALELEKAVEDGDEDRTVQVNLKYWYGRCECWSQWRQVELEKLRKFVDKIQKMTFEDVKLDAGLDLTMHQGPAKGAGFTRPYALSKDLSLFEMKLGGKARVHGFFREHLFFLVWLDRNHAVFPDK